MTALQHTVTTALKHWLDVNKGEVLQAVREAVLQSEAAKDKQRQQQIKRGEFLTVAEIARRWQFHPESVRRMIRQGVVLIRHPFCNPRQGRLWCRCLSRN